MKEILPGILIIKYFRQRDSVKTANVRKKFSKFKVVSAGFFFFFFVISLRRFSWPNAAMPPCLLLYIWAEALLEGVPAPQQVLLSRVSITTVTPSRLLGNNRFQDGQ